MFLLRLASKQQSPTVIHDGGTILQFRNSIKIKKSKWCFSQTSPLRRTKREKQHPNLIPYLNAWITPRLTTETISCICHKKFSPIFMSICYRITRNRSLAILFSIQMQAILKILLHVTHVLSLKFCNVLLSSRCLQKPCKNSVILSRSLVTSLWLVKQSNQPSRNLAFLSSKTIQASPETMSTRSVWSGIA